jgi:hypothetical protein
MSLSLSLAGWSSACVFMNLYSTDSVYFLHLTR